MAISADEVSRRYPIHWLVWNNRHEELKSSLAANKYTPEELETKDIRGRTPLLLAVTLGYIDSVKVLIEAGADINCEKDGWTAVQEATATGNPELLSMVLLRRDTQRIVLRCGGIPDLLRRLSLAPDFYVEMKWEFTSWVPLVSRMCPFDTYKVYKRGANVRVDTTLVGFENNRWQRGDRTYIFRGEGETASLKELDHELGTVWWDCLEPVDPEDVRAFPAPRQSVIDSRLTSPLAINYLDTDKISFERSKSGIWGWRQDKTEAVNGYECKVFSANNVELVSKTRCEHVPGAARRPASRAPLAGLLDLATESPAVPLLAAEKEEDTPRSSQSREDLSSFNPVTWEEYFSGEALERDIGRPREVSTKVQKFRATLWLCEDYPLELQEQIMPILDLMATLSSPHFAKLKDFIQMQLPSGFPVKIEIPLFHVLNARITFGNIFATESPVPHISSIQEGDRLSCVVDDQCFEIGRNYRDAVVPGEDRLSYGVDDEEGLLQYAIQQSLIEGGGHDDKVDVWEALRGSGGTEAPAGGKAGGGGAHVGSRASPTDLLAHEERQLQRAIEASLGALQVQEPSGESPAEAPQDLELLEALVLSAQEQEAARRQMDAEQRALDEALRLSLLDK